MIVNNLQLSPKVNLLDEVIMLWQNSKHVWGLRSLWTVSLLPKLSKSCRTLQCSDEIIAH